MPEEVLSDFYTQYWGVTCPRHLTDEMARYLSVTAGKRFYRDHSLNKLADLAGPLKGKKILDVGCGFGEKASILKSLEASIHGIDISPAAVSFCNDKLGIKTECTSIENMDAPEKLFDVVLMFEFIEHPMEPLAALKAALDRMKTGALLVIVTPNGTAGERWWYTREREWVGFRVDLEHLHYLHVDTINHLCNVLNLRLVHLEQFGHRSLDDVLTPPRTEEPRRLRYVSKCLKSMPGVRRTVYALTEYRQKLNDIARLPVAGDFHLFTILQKK